MNRILVVVYVALTIGRSLSATLPEINLSGKWSLTTTGDQAQDLGEIAFIPTHMTNSEGQTLYAIEGTIDGDRLWGAAIEENGHGQPVIGWYLLKGLRLDGEYTMILNWSDTEISLGGDYENYEIAKLKKVANLYDEPLL